MWQTKDDVLKDLAECTGVPVNNIDDDFIVRGTRPPPPVKANEIDNEEFNLWFGGCGDQLPSSGPDLDGITKMLRMVNTLDRTQETYPLPSTTSLSPRNKKAPNDIIVISKPEEISPKTKNQINIQSKLNPNVSEFVPKFVKPASLAAATLAGKENGADTNGISNLIMEPNAAIVDTDTDNLINEDTIVNTSTIDKEESERQKMVALLKSKISASCKENTVQRKREKNVALAALLRLNSGQPTTPPSAASASPKSASQPESNNNQEMTPPLVLFTPDYFAGPSCSPKMVDVDDSEHNIPEPKPLLESPLKTPSPDQLHDPQIKESIDKVNNWLNSPQKAKASIVSPHIGPVMFKKKESYSSQSPSSEASKRGKQPYAIPSFKPSQYASELAKDLEARVKAKEEKEVKSQPPLDIWTKLEMDLKARDKIVIERLREANENEPHSSGSSSSYSRKRLN